MLSRRINMNCLSRARRSLRQNAMKPQFHLGDKVNVIINGERTHGKIIAYPNGPVTVQSSNLSLNRIYNYSIRYKVPDETEFFTNNGELYAYRLTINMYYLVELASSHIISLGENDLVEFQNILNVIDEKMNIISKWKHPVRKSRLPSELNDVIESYLLNFKIKKIC